MNKDEKIKKLKESIARVKRAITQLSYMKYDIMDVIDFTDDYSDIMVYNERAIQDLQIIKSKLENNLKTLQESNENANNLDCNI